MRTRGSEIIDYNASRTPPRQPLRAPRPIGFVVIRGEISSRGPPSRRRAAVRCSTTCADRSVPLVVYGASGRALTPPRRRPPMVEICRLVADGLVEYKQVIGTSRLRRLAHRPALAQARPNGVRSCSIPRWPCRRSPTARLGEIFSTIFHPLSRKPLALPDILVDDRDEVARLLRPHQLVECNYCYNLTGSGSLADLDEIRKRLHPTVRVSKHFRAVSNKDGEITIADLRCAGHKKPRGSLPRSYSPELRR
jgi:hypothetical protein